MASVSNFELDLTGQLVIAASSVDASVTIPVSKPINLGQSPRASSDLYWQIMIGGNPCYLNVGAAATNANVCAPVGYMPQPMRLAPGQVLHALASTSTAIVSLIRCFPIS